MSPHIRPTWRVIVSAVVVLCAAAGCDEARLPGGAGTTGPAGQPASQGGPTDTGSGSAEPPGGGSAEPPGGGSAEPPGGGSAEPPGAGPAADGQVSALFEVSGSGKAISLHVDDGTSQGLDLYNVPVPFRKQTKVDANVALLQVHAAGVDGQASCRISLDGKVVVENTDAADCVYSRPGGH
jgi:hypothetical protein